MPQKRTSNWDYDSVKAHYAKYKDSVAVDWVYSEETGNFETVYIHKDADYNNSVKSSDFNELSHELQYYIVPGFFALIIAFFIFGSLVMRDNRAAMVRKDKDSILSMMKNDAKKN
jgi:hypothetical protein